MLSFTLDGKTFWEWGAGSSFRMETSGGKEQLSTNRVRVCILSSSEGKRTPQGNLGAQIGAVGKI